MSSLSSAQVQRAIQRLNRYRRGLETCPQATLAKMSTLFSSLFFQRVRATSMTQRRAENTLSNLSHSRLYRLSIF